MRLLPTRPRPRARSHCPNCSGRIADGRAPVCDRCGYQLRLPRAGLAGILLLAAALANLLLSAFGGWLFPFPAMPFGLRFPYLESPTPDDLRTLAFWIGVVLAVAGVAAAYAGAYSARRRADRTRAGRA